MVKLLKLLRQFLAIISLHLSFWKNSNDAVVRLLPLSLKRAMETLKSDKSENGEFDDLSLLFSWGFMDVII